MSEKCFLQKCHLTCCCVTVESTSWLNGIVFAVSSRIIRETPAWVSVCWQADCVMGAPCAWTCYPLGCLLNTVLCVDGDDGHTDHISSRSRKLGLEGSCYQAPFFLSVLHGAKLKPCVFSPCGRLHTTGLVSWLASSVVFLTTCDLRKHPPPVFCHCYLNPTSV